MTEQDRRWADRASALYDREYAKKYRDRDDQLQQTASHRALIAWLGGVCDRFDHPIDVLDLGCGTGRYFWGVRNVSTLVGLDASAAMLAEARHPVHGDQLGTTTLTLIEGDLMSHDFEPARFDLVYSIGVLAEHVPLAPALVERIGRWLRPGGRFAFTTVDPESPSVPKTLPRRLAGWALHGLPVAWLGGLHDLFVAHGLYADEIWIRDRLADAFELESYERFETDVHLHGLCVARRRS